MSNAIKCPSCGCAESEVKDSRPSVTVGTRRRRQCSGCGHRFTTGEFVIETRPGRRRTAALEAHQ